MKIVVTRKELQLYVDFEGWLRESPCKICPDKFGCCGCPKQKEWNARKPEGLTEQEYADSGLLFIYAKAAQDYAKARSAKEKSDEALDRVRNRYDSILEKITIEEDEA